MITLTQLKNKEFVLQIAIWCRDLSTDKDDILKSLSNDINLINAIDRYKMNLGTVKIIETNKNILTTENGYYIAIYK